MTGERRWRVVLGLIVAAVLALVIGIKAGHAAGLRAVAIGIVAIVAVLARTSIAAEKDLPASRPNTDPNALYLLGMVSYLTGAIQAPMTAFVIVAELADAHGMIIPLMATALVAHTISRVVCAKGIYHALSEEFMPAGKDKSG